MDGIGIVRRMFRQPRLPPPPPPPLIVNTTATTVGCAIFVIYFGFLATGNLCVTRQRTSRYLPLAVGVFALARLAIAGTLLPISGFSVLGGSVPVTAFSLLFLVCAADAFPSSGLVH